MVSYITNAQAIARCNESATLHDTGTINPNGVVRIYAGAVPADADAPLGAATMIVELPFSIPAFQPAVDTSPGASATANAITATANTGTGTATFFRTYDRDGVTVRQGDVGLSGSGAEMILVSVDFPTTGLLVSLSSFVITEAEVP